jgi:molybdopterin converting factor small subunit
MNIRLRFYGVFKSAANTGEFKVDLENEAPTVRALVRELTSQFQFLNLKKLLLNDNNEDPRPNALIMVSGKEIGTLSGLDTVLTEDDEVTFLPIAHGG